MNTVKASLFIFLISGSLLAQEKDKPRIFITDSDSWVISGGGRGSFGGSVKGGARPQTAEIIKTFNERCPGCTVTMKKERADYIIVLEHEGGKSLFRNDNKFTVFNREGDAIKSGSTRVLGNAVKEACRALERDWRSRKATLIRTNLERFSSGGET